MAELSADIIVNAQNANRQLARVTRGFNQAGDAAEDMGQDAFRAGQQFNQFNFQFNQFAQGASRAGSATQRLNRSVGNSTQIFFQAGQAISDFAVAGIRGAANNLEFLALQMGVGGPVLIAIAALTTAFVVFGEDIAKALNPAREELKRLEEGIKDIFAQINNLDLEVPFLTTQIPTILDELSKQIDRLKIELSTIKPEDVVQGVNVFSDEDQARINAITENINKATVALTFFEEKSEEVGKNLLANDAAQFSSTLNQNKAFISELRLRAEKLGLEQEILGISNQQLLSVIDEGREEEFIKDLLEKKNKAKKEELSTLEKLEKKNRDLKASLESLQSIDEIRLGNLIEGNRILDERIKKLQEEARIAASLAKINILPSPGASGFTQEDEFLGQGGGPLGTPSDLEETLSKLKPLTLETVEISKELADIIRDLGFEYNSLTDEQLRVIELNKELAESVRGGLTNAFAGFFEAIGSGDDPFASLRETVGSFMVDMGKTFIAFGIAGESIKAFAKGNPVAAIIAGGALVALGSALRKSAEGKASNFGSSDAGREAAPLTPGFIDPRQGRTGRFQRDTAELNEARVPGSLQIDIFGEFSLTGRDLTASVERTQQTQRRTRGPRSQ